jgi:predicted nucleotidyltransferase
MTAADVMKDPHLERMLADLKAALSGGLVGVVLYGSAARGDFHARTSDLNLLVVTRDLDVPTLERLAPALRRWGKQGHPAPRLFTPALLAESADVFPIEMLDLRHSRVVLHGEDPLARVEVGRENLRLQCERELRAKLMRLREGYIECHDRPRELRRLLTASYTTFVALFRGCLHLLGGQVPGSNAEVVAAFCARAGLEAGAFSAVDRLKRGEGEELEPKAVFSRYYQELTRAVGSVDRFDSRQGGQGS